MEITGSRYAVRHNEKTSECKPRGGQDYRTDFIINFFMILGFFFGLQ